MNSSPKKKEKLIDVLEKSIRKAGYIVKKDKFSDNSSSWLEIHNPDIEDYLVCISFNGKGKKLTEIEVWKSEVKEVIEDEKKIF